MCNHLEHRRTASCVELNNLISVFYGSEFSLGNRPKIKIMCAYGIRLCVRSQLTGGCQLPYTKDQGRRFVASDTIFLLYHYSRRIPSEIHLIFISTLFSILFRAFPLGNSVKSAISSSCVVTSARVCRRKITRYLVVNEKSCTLPYVLVKYLSHPNESWPYRCVCFSFILYFLRMIFNLSQCQRHHGLHAVSDVINFHWYLTTPMSPDNTRCLVLYTLTADSTDAS